MIGCEVDFEAHAGQANEQIFNMSEKGAWRQIKELGNGYHKNLSFFRQKKGSRNNIEGFSS